MTGSQALTTVHGRCCPIAVYENGLRSVSGKLWIRHTDGRREPLPVGRWRGGVKPGDASLLRRCNGPTLDVGCGPGRLAAALTGCGIPTLGIDVAPFAVELARRAGAVALRRDVFDHLPGEGRWAVLVLADGNIGIGGDPARLLRRAAELLAPAGRALIELEPPGTQTGTSLIRLEGPDGRLSRAFPWTFVGIREIAHLTVDAGLRVTEIWRSQNRYFAVLSAMRHAPRPFPPDSRKIPDQIRSCYLEENLA
ncbi:MULTISPECIES: class I SAM-dependent methyltransferase [Protofrankia]|uniref:Methyltransferase type 11 n=1 Tax=Candidatus Protofrankia datiscae TaxID=2716812 RepID=F8B0W8_9ACTN|nr:MULTISPECIES: methyltransferase domain-containing protein [Protofrankia]AEH07868.1 methyltransferase type 11 [Candidatus Protofrankia datiscae]